MPTEHRQQIGRSNWACGIELTTGKMTADSARFFGAVATLVIESGAGRLQTYATAKQLHDLALALMAAAGELESAEQAGRLDALASQMEAA